MPEIDLGYVLGPKGDPGEPGRDGTDGTPGAPGAPGTDGKSAYQYAKEGGFVGTEEQFYTALAEVVLKMNKVIPRKVDTIATLSAAGQAQDSGKTLGDYYTKEETFGKGDVYTKNDTYSQTQANEKFAAKNTVYTKEQVLQGATAKKFGLAETATPDEVFQTIKEFEDAKTIFAEGSYVGTGTYGTENPNKLTLSGRPKLLCILDTFYRQGLIVPLYTESEIISPSFLPAVWDSKPIVFSVSGNTVSWYNATNAIYQMNESGRKYHYKTWL